MVSGMQPCTLSLGRILTEERFAAHGPLAYSDIHSTCNNYGPWYITNVCQGRQELRNWKVVVGGMKSPTPPKAAADLSSTLGPCIGPNPETRHDSDTMQRRLCGIFKVFRLMCQRLCILSVRALMHSLWAYNATDSPSPFRGTGKTRPWIANNTWINGTR